MKLKEQKSNQEIELEAVNACKRLTEQIEHLNSSDVKHIIACYFQKSNIGELPPILKKEVASLQRDLQIIKKHTILFKLINNILEIALNSPQEIKPLYHALEMVNITAKRNAKEV